MLCGGPGGAGLVPAAREPVRRKGWGAAVAQLWRNAREPEVRDVDTSLGALGRLFGAAGDPAVFLQDIPGVLDRYRTAPIGEGAFFGEIAALGRSPRTATVFAEEPSELLEIRWQGLRDIRRRAPQIRAHIDGLYRKHSLEAHLRQTPLFAHLSAEDLARVADATAFESHGEFEWHTSFKSLATADPSGRLDREPLIAEEGHYPGGLILVRSGFARVSERHHRGERTVSYLGKGQAFGLDELVAGWRTGTMPPYRRSLRAVGYVDVLVVPTHVLEAVVLPGTSAELLPPEKAPAATEERPAATAETGSGLPQSLLEFLADRRVINGTATMVIDLDRCVRCDDCVAACATTHDGNPRFLRSGPRHGSTMVASACMHCVDPVCMIGCPTGAIRRDEVDGQVVIHDRTCIGCSTCAESCPYETIRMVEPRDQSGALLLDNETGLPILKATKCDLCREQPSGPACVSACSWDALRRVGLQDLVPLSEWLGAK